MVPPPMQLVYVIWGVGPPVGHEAGGHIPPLALVFHGGGQGVSLFTKDKYDVRHDVVDIHDDPPGRGPDGELLHVGDAGDPQVKVKGCCPVRFRGGALGVPFVLCIVQGLQSAWADYSWGCPLHRSTDGAGLCRCLDPMGWRALGAWALTGHPFWLPPCVTVLHRGCGGFRRRSQGGIVAAKMHLVGREGGTLCRAGGFLVVRHAL